MMGYFPMCVDIEGEKVYLVGQGEETEYKLKKLKLFSEEFRAPLTSTSSLTLTS